MENTTKRPIGRRVLQAVMLAPALVLGYASAASATTGPDVAGDVTDLATAQVPTMLLVIVGIAGATAVVAIARWGVNSLFSVFGSGGKKAAK